MATVIIVSAYSMKLILKLQSEVRPIVNLDHPSASKNVRTISRMVESFDILRDNSNPHLFYKKVKIRQDKHIIISCVPPIIPNVLEKAKIVFVNNLMTFCIIMMMLPNYVMNLILYLEDKVCDKNLGFKVSGKIARIISLVSHLCIPFFVMEKLSKF